MSVRFFTFLVGLCVFLSATAEHAWSQKPLWARSIAKGNITELTTDDSGNIYVAGTFSDTTDFDPGPGVANLYPVFPGSNITDVFFAKYTSTGQYLWAKSIGSSWYDYVGAITVDHAGNLWITGAYYTAIDLDPGAGVANVTSTSTSSAVYFAKYNPQGNYLFGASIGNTDYNKGTGLAVDSANNLYLTGFFSGTADFDPAAPVANLTSSGYTNTFFARYTPTGQYVWAKKIGAGGHTRSTALRVDDSAHVYITGTYVFTVDFDPGPGTANLTAPSNGIYTNDDIFFAKYTANGNYVWAKSIGGISADAPTDLAIGDSGDVYLTGSFTGFSDFDPGPGAAYMSPPGNSQGSSNFFAKYNCNGEYRWAKQLSGPSSSALSTSSMAVDRFGNVYLVGNLFSKADFDPGPDTAYSQPLISPNMFFAKYDSAGSYLWHRYLNMNQGATSAGYAIRADTDGTFLLTGMASGAYSGPVLADTLQPGTFFARFNTCALRFEQTAPVRCFGDSNGVVQVRLLGGSGAISYAWTGGPGTATYSGLPAVGLP